jgi:hypothetical protein
VVRAGFNVVDSISEQFHRLVRNEFIPADMQLECVLSASEGVNLEF